MKKSITFLAIAILAAGSAFAGNTVENENATAGTSKYISFADESLVESETVGLKKTERTASETIESDRKITEAAPVPYVYLAKPQKLELPSLRN
ncbi:MAG TPA: hypothetical protein VK183_12910 [Flavobacterium sp.]|nr:hypothetical protein [Flavobacterium sp.]